jgi:glycosyltransferase involved in cell wall biosynthesis
MPEQRLDYLIIGPVAPFRGGIAETQYELATHLLMSGKKVQLLTFSKLYPKILFPGKNQKTKEKQQRSLKISESIHAYNPLQWAKVVREINQLNPRNLIFRYYTPFLAPVYGWLAKKTASQINKIALVDNWIPHERRALDRILNRFFGKQMQAFTTLSTAVATQIKIDFKQAVWEGFHPINTQLLPPISKLEARKRLGWNQQQTTVLFFGLIRQYKGLELLIQSFTDKALDSHNTVLKIVGECYENQKKYTDLVSQLGLEDTVSFDFEYKSLSDIQTLFSACDLVAQTYHTASQSGVTPLAYFYSKPLVVSDIEGLNGPIKKDKTGVCVQKTPKAIAEGIIGLLDYNKYQKAKDNLKKSLPNYQWKVWVEQWSDFIENL